MNGAHTSASEMQERRRHLTMANGLYISTAVVVFLLLVTIWDTNQAIITASVIAGVLSALVWLLVSYISAEPHFSASLGDLPLLGSIPIDDHGPASVLNNTESAERYTGVLRAVEENTTGQILLISSPEHTQGASTVALNLAIASTKAGRRVMLIDADPAPGGLGRFLSTGVTPGLSEIATGNATLSGSARMLNLSEDARFPILPSGASLTTAEGVDGALIAEALDTVCERADLLIIDSPPVLLSSVTEKIGVHADGTILVIDGSTDPTAITASIDRLEKKGAPVLGYVRNRQVGAPRLAPIWFRRALLHGVAATLLLMVIFGAYTASQLLYSWNSVETETLDIARVTATTVSDTPQVIEESVELDIDEEPPASLPATTAPEEAYETFLIIGRDAVAGAADVIIYLVNPTNSSKPFMVSLPRDLFVENVCTGGNSKINSLIHGCPSNDVNGVSLLSYTVGQFTGIEVDHFAMFNFDGFERIIDAIGGVEICVDYPVYDKQSGLSLPAGCTNATGEQALSWVRSRHMLQKINGSWRSVPGTGDLQRNQHQQEVIVELFKELKSFDSPTELTAQVAGLADAFTLDDSLSITDAVSLAWSMRDLDLEDINRLEIPVRMTRSSTGLSILVATTPFDEVLVEIYGGGLPNEDTEDDKSTASNN